MICVMLDYLCFWRFDGLCILLTNRVIIELPDRVRFVLTNHVNFFILTGRVRFELPDRVSFVVARAREI